VRKFIFILIIAVTAGTGLYLGLDGKGRLAQILPSDDQSTEETTQNLPPLVVSEVFREPVVYGALSQTYSRSDFSFSYPTGFRVNSVPVEGGEMVTIENQDGTGFQIFIIPFDEPGMITPERIRQDLPDAIINEPKVADLDGVRTLVFSGYDEALGDTFEAWAVDGGKLYQISGPETATDLVIETLETWDWK
jgi:hypothetical protein